MQRIPLTTARRLGLARLTDLAGAEPVMITRYGHPDVVIASAERVDDDLHRMRAAALTVLDAAADLVTKRTPRHTLNETCARIGVDTDEVRRRAAGLAAD